MAYASSNLVTPAQTALNKQKAATFPGLEGGISYSAYKAASTPAANATSTITKQPVYVAPPAPSYGSQSNSAANATSTITGQPVYKAPPAYNPAPSTTSPSPVLSSPPVQPTATQTYQISPFAGTNPGKTPEQLKAEGAPQDPTAGNSGSTPQNSPTPTFSGLVGSLVGAAQGNQAIGQNAADIASKYGAQIAQTGLLGNSARGGYLTTGTTPVAEGNAAVIAQTTAAQQQAEAAAGNMALQGTGQQLTSQAQQQSGLNQAAGYAQPQLAGYNNQSFNPLTGQFGTGSTGGTAMSQLPSQAQSAISSYAQQVKNGSMTRSDAESRLSAYGQPGLNALNEALGSGFNTNASNASAGTTAQGQQIQTAAASTNAALDTLASAFTSLNLAQTAGIPASNSVANWIATQLGSQALQKFQTNLADARSQLIGVLNSSGGTPTGNEATAQQYLPDNMTKAQFDTNVGTAQNPGIVRQLVAQKVGAFTNSGQQNNQPQNASSNLFSW